MYRNIHLKLHILLTMIYVGFIFRYPNHVPMVDDWYLIPWTTPGASLNLNSMFSLLQGHQYFLGKLYAYSTGVLLGGNLFFASILMVILFSCGSYWIAKTIIDHSTFRQEDKIL